jgi:hypothetical protein
VQKEESNSFLFLYLKKMEEEEERTAKVRQQMSARKVYHVMDVPMAPPHDPSAPPPVIIGVEQLQREYNIIVGKTIPSDKPKVTVSALINEPSTPSTSSSVPQPIPVSSPVDQPPPQKRAAPSVEDYSTPADVAPTNMELLTQAGEPSPSPPPQLLPPPSPIQDVPPPQPATQQTVTATVEKGMADLNARLLAIPSLKRLLHVHTGDAVGYSLDKADCVLTGGLFGEIVNTFVDTEGTSVIPVDLQPLCFNGAIVPSTTTTELFLQTVHNNALFGIGTENFPIKIGWWVQPLVYIDKCYKGIMSLTVCDPAKLAYALIDAVVQNLKAFLPYVTINAVAFDKVKNKYPNVFFAVHREMIESWAISLLTHLASQAVVDVPNYDWAGIWSPVVRYSKGEPMFDSSLVPHIIAALNAAKAHISEESAQLFRDILLSQIKMNGIVKVLERALEISGLGNETRSPVFLALSAYIGNLANFVSRSRGDIKEIEFATFPEFVSIQNPREPVELTYVHTTTKWYVKLIKKQKRAPKPKKKTTKKST